MPASTKGREKLTVLLVVRMVIGLAPVTTRSALMVASDGFAEPCRAPLSYGGRAPHYTAATQMFRPRPCRRRLTRRPRLSVNRCVRVARPASDGGSHAFQYRRTNRP